MTPATALVVALAEERRILQPCLRAARRDRLGGHPIVYGRLAERDVILVQAGIGFVSARDAVLRVSRRFELMGAWSLGFAGGLTELLGPGDLVCPTAILPEAPGAREAPMDAGAPVAAALRTAGLRAHTGTLITVRAPLRTPEAKRAAHRKTGAVVVDMEAAGVLAATRDLGIPVFALKAILDPVGDALPEFLAGCTTPSGDLRWRGLLAAILGPRGHRRSLAGLRRGAREARQSLRQGLTVAFPAWVALTAPGLSSTM